MVVGRFLLRMALTSLKAQGNSESEDPKPVSQLDTHRCPNLSPINVIRCFLPPIRIATHTSTNFHSLVK